MGVLSSDPDDIAALKAVLRLLAQPLRPVRQPACGPEVTTPLVISGLDPFLGARTLPSPTGSVRLPQRPRLVSTAPQASAVFFTPMEK